MVNVCIVGLNPGTVYLTLILSRVVPDITIITHFNDYEIEFYGLSMLDFVGDLDLEKIKICTLSYLTDILGIKIIHVNNLSKVECFENKVKINNSILKFSYVIPGAEIKPQSIDYINKLIRNDIPSRKSIIITGFDYIKAIELFYKLLKEHDNTYIDSTILQKIDNDVITSLSRISNVEFRVSNSQVLDEGIKLSTSFEISTPVVRDEKLILGKGVELVDKFSGLKFRINRDLHLILIAKNYILNLVGKQDLLITRFDFLNVLLPDNKTILQFLIIGFQKNECELKYPDVRSSRSTYYDKLGNTLINKLIYRYDKVLGLITLSKGFDLTQLASLLYSIFKTSSYSLFYDLVNFLHFNTFRGLFENSILSLIEDLLEESFKRRNLPIP